MSNYWLARTTNHELLGPVTEAQVKAWVIEGKLKPQDEICESLGYWFSLYEFDELEKHLGIRPQDLQWTASEEVTQLHVHNEATDPSFASQKKPASVDEIQNPSLESETVLRGLLWMVMLILVVVAVLVLRKVKL